MNYGLKADARAGPETVALLMKFAGVEMGKHHGHGAKQPSGKGKH